MFQSCPIFNSGNFIKDDCEGRAWKLWFCYNTSDFETQRNCMPTVLAKVNVRTSGREQQQLVITGFLMHFIHFARRCRHESCYFSCIWYWQHVYVKNSYINIKFSSFFKFLRYHTPLCVSEQLYCIFKAWWVNSYFKTCGGAANVSNFSEGCEKALSGVSNGMYASRPSYVNRAFVHLFPNL